MIAAEFVRAGCALVPIPLGNKAPRANGWQKRENAITDAAKVADGCNYGLLHAWSGTCAIDIDDFDAADAWLTARGINVESLFCAENAVSVSSGRPGRAKLLYRLPNGDRPTTRRIMADDGSVILEFRCASTSGESMQDVIAGTHPGGTAYTVNGDPARMPELPEALRKLWDERVSPSPSVSAGSIPEGARDDSLFKLARRLHNAGIGEAAILAALTAENARCSPPLPANDLRRIARSASTLTDRPDWQPPSSPLVDAKALVNDALRIYETGLKRGDLPGWPSVDALYSVAAGQWTVITGVPSSGKSEWLDAMLVNLAERDDSWQFGIYSPENWPTSTHLIKLAEKRVRKPFNAGVSPRMTQAEFAQAAEWLTNHFFWIDPTLKTPEELIETSLSFRRPGGKFGIVLDPWNTLDHVRGGLSETDYVSSILTKVTRLARSSQAHVWLVVHPTKPGNQSKKMGEPYLPTPYDLHGSAAWFAKADNIICVHRDGMETPQDVQIHIQKVRMKHLGERGLATLKYDKVVGRYFELAHGVPGELYADPERRF